MKTTKFFLIATFYLFISCCYSQEHLMFKNIPLNGNIDIFASELIKEGFEIKEKNENAILMSGTYVNRLCDIIVFATKKTKSVWRVNIYLPKDTIWNSIKNDYFELKKQFITKYGKGKSYEFFSKPYKEGDGYEMLAVLLENCHYATYWKTQRGMISLNISTFKKISIKYEDNTNSALDEKETSEEISKEI